MKLHKRYKVLAYIKDNPGLTRRQITDATGVSYSSCSTYLFSLGSAGLVRKEFADGEWTYFAADVKPEIPVLPWKDYPSIYHFCLGVMA